jgi:hypothetical protein
VRPGATLPMLVAEVVRGGFWGAVPAGGGQLAQAVSTGGRDADVAGARRVGTGPADAGH